MRIKNIGIDAVEIERFKRWNTYKKETLLRVFTQLELDYILACPEKSAERFATRFAVKEAVFKSISSSIANSFFAAMHHIEVIKMESGDIACRIGWERLQHKTNTVPQDILVSVTHTRTTAIAIVMMQ